MTVSGVPPSINAAAMSADQKTALAKLAATAPNTSKTLFSSELAKTFGQQSKSDTYTPQVATSVASNSRPSVFMPAAASQNMPASPTTSTSSARPASNRRQRRKTITASAQKL